MFDLPPELAGIGAFGLRVAEKIAVSLAVLIFFWGAFALIAAATRRAPWKLSPLIAVFAYGWTFEMGFMNYYISLGLCFFALAAFWRFGNRGALISLALIPLIWMAHPLGVICLAGMARICRPGQGGAASLSGISFAGGGNLFVRRADVPGEALQVRWNVLARYFFFNGADQLRSIACAITCSIRYSPRSLWALDQGASSRWREGGFWEACGIPRAALCGDGNGFDPFAFRGCLSAVPGAFVVSHAAAHFGVGNFGVLDARHIETQEVARRWACALIAAVFFIFLYIDTGALNKMEEQVERLVAALPAGHRVVERHPARRKFPSGDRAHRGSRLHRTVLQLRQLRAGHRRSFGSVPRRAIRSLMPDAGEPSGARSERSCVKALDPPVFEISQCERRRRR